MKGKYEEKRKLVSRAETQVALISHLGDNVAASQEERRETPSHGVTTCPTPGYNDDDEEDTEQAIMMYSLQRDTMIMRMMRSATSREYNAI